VIAAPYEALNVEAVRVGALAVETVRVLDVAVFDSPLIVLVTVTV
jgi:hypothetical protein